MNSINQLIACANEERHDMRRYLKISLFIIMLATGCNNQLHPSKEEIAEIKRVEIEKKKVEEEKKFQQNLAIARNANLGHLERLRALDKVADVDEKLATEIRRPILEEIDNNIAAQKKADEKHAKEEKKRKKTEGVRIGMTMQDVIDSSWGKPQHTTTYHTAMGELTIWQYGEYGERGSISFKNGIIEMIQN